MKKLYLHIGTEKTGTTLLQEWLYTNKKNLSKNGIYLPNQLGEPNNILLPTYFQGHLDDWAWSKRIQNKQEKDIFFEGFLNRVTDEITTAKNNHDTFIITSEHFHSRLQLIEEIQNLYVFLKSLFDEIYIICYFREQFDTAISLYSTFLKREEVRDIDSFLNYGDNKVTPENYYFNYLNIADNWASVFKSKNCIFKVYDKSRFVDNDLRKDFILTLNKDIDLDKFDWSITSKNESLFALQSIAYRYINQIISHWNQNKLGQNLENIHAKNKINKIESLKLIKIYSGQSDIIRKKFKTINKKFFAKYFNSQDFFQPLDDTNVEVHKINDYEKAIKACLELGIDLHKSKNTNVIKDILKRYDAKHLELRDAIKLTKITEKKPTASVIIPVYNVGKYIKKCIKSVLNQSYSNIEIIVIDDFSQDNSISKVREFKDSRIKILSHKCNRGSAAARNTGMDAAKGEFIIFLDSDDYIDCDLIKKCIERQQKNDVDCVVFNTQFVDDNYNIWVSPLLWNQYFFGNGIENGSIDDDGTKTLVGWDVAAWSKFIRLDYLKQNKIYFLEEHRYFEDHYFSAKLYLSKAKFSYIDEKLHYYLKRSSIKNKSITQLNSPIMGLHRSQVFRDTCLLIESFDHKYKNIFYTAYF